MRTNHWLPIFLRVCAAAVLLAGVGCFVFLMDFRGEITGQKLAMPVLCLLVAIGVAAAMLGVAALLSAPQDAQAEQARAVARLQTQLTETATRIGEMHAVIDRLARDAHSPAPPLAQPVAPTYFGIQPSDLEPIYQGLHELHEMSLLPESERRERFERHRRERRAALVKHAFELVAARAWPKAEQIVVTLEKEFPNDDEVSKSRDYLNHSRRLNEQESIARARREIDRLISLADWDDALAQARALANGFPDNAEARDLLTHVTRERNQYEEINVQRMFEELRHDVDRRLWRRALLHAERILERFPDHPRAEAVRRQLKTLQDNAEIEERQEQEVRIQELVKSHQFNEAIELAQDLIKRYPLSPQAESLEMLLPRIRELAAQGPMVTEFAGVEATPPATSQKQQSSASPQSGIDAEADDIVTGFHG